MAGEIAMRNRENVEKLLVLEQSRSLKISHPSSTEILILVLISVSILTNAFQSGDKI